MIDEWSVAKVEVVQQLDRAIADGNRNCGCDDSELILLAVVWAASEPQRQQRKRHHDGNEVVAYDKLHDGVECGRFAHEAVQPKKYGFVYVRQWFRTWRRLRASTRA